MSDSEMADVDSDADDIEEADDREEKDYILVARQVIHIRIPVRARDDDEARQIGCDALAGMRFKTYIHNYDGRRGAEMIGLEEEGRPAQDVTFDTGERPDTDDVEVEQE